MHFARLFLWLLTTAFCLLAASARAETWQAGVAEVVITPEKLMWMSGYGARDHRAEGKLHDLYCKTLVLEADGDTKLVLVTLDLVGIDRGIMQNVCRRAEKELGIARKQIALNCSHTHCGPAAGTTLAAMFTFGDDDKKLVYEYTEQLENKIVECIGRALQDVAPARVSWGGGSCSFAVNRRNNKEAEITALREAGTPLKGPNDFDVPVLAVHDAAGKLKAITFGYACHATVLSFYQWCGDYPGFAFRELQKRHPGAVALFWAGCGADQNPLPRRTVELAEKYGVQLADAVDAVLAGGAMQTLTGRIDAAYDEVTLDFQRVPTKEECEVAANSTNKSEAGRAKMFLAELAAGRPIAASYPYPIQSWKLGAAGPRWVLLGGEVVVDYVLRLKQELGPTNTWVAGYTNDVMAYIPSRRVLTEGGYEGATSMLPYGRPSPWAPELEEKIVRQVHAQAGK
jgi:hypothetical protein